MGHSPATLRAAAVVQAAEAALVLAATVLAGIDTAAGRRIWDDYVKIHDVSSRNGQTAGIDPGSGRIWLGESVERVVAQRNADGFDAPLFFVRVGSPTYYRKGGPR